MRTILTAAALLVAAALAPVPVTAELPVCPPDPLNHAHSYWMKMPSTAVDLHTPPPASASNPLMIYVGRALPAPGPAVEAGSVQVNPLTHK